MGFRLTAKLPLSVTKPNCRRSPIVQQLEKIFILDAWQGPLPITQPAFTYSKLTTETLEQGMNMIKVNNKDIRKTKRALFWCLYC